MSCGCDTNATKLFTATSSCEAILFPRLAQLATELDRLDVLIWLYEQGLLLVISMMNKPVEIPCKYPRIAFWLHEHARGTIRTLVLDDYCSNYECYAFVKWAHEHRDAYNIDNMQKALHHSISHGHLELLQWIYNNYFYVRSNRKGFSIAISNGHLKVAKWLYQFHPQGYFYDPRDGSSDLQMNTWLLCEYIWFGTKQRRVWIEKSFELSARDNQKEVVEFLHFLGPGSATGITMENAAAAGHLGMIRFLHSQQAKCTQQAMDLAAAYNHLEVVQWLHRNRLEGCTTNAMDLAAANGHFEMVRWLYENRHEGCTVDAMNDAAKGGYFEIVQFLFENGAGIISDITAINAALHDHLELVKWIHANASERLDATFAGVDDLFGVFWLIEGSEYNAWSVMEGAVAAGHIRIVDYLHTHAKKRCTPKAMRKAAFEGHVDVVKWYYALPGDKCELLEDAAMGGSLKVVKFLMHNGETKCTPQLLDRVANENHFAILEWLLRHSQTQGTSNIYIDA